MQAYLCTLLLVQSKLGAATLRPVRQIQSMSYVCFHILSDDWKKVKRSENYMKKLYENYMKFKFSIYSIAIPTCLYIFCNCFWTTVAELKSCAKDYNGPQSLRYLPLWPLWYWFPTFSPPGNSFMEESFFHRPGWRGDGFRIIQAQNIYCAHLFLLLLNHLHLRSSDIRSRRLEIPALQETCAKLGSRQLNCANELKSILTILHTSGLIFWGED